MIKQISVMALSIFFVGLISGCSSTKVTRVPPEKIVDLSGRFNDTDSRLVADEIINDCLNGLWLKEYVEKNQKPPVVIVGFIKNRSQEHLTSELFTKDLERSLVNSGKVKFVASKSERTDVREERNDQNESGYTDEATRKKIGKETGADFMLIGSVNSVKDEATGKYVILYQVNLELVDLTTNEKPWIGQKDIKKIVQKSKYSL